jgi:ATP-dependent helicase/nuclease subunit A
VFEVTRYTAAELRGWQNPGDSPPVFSARQEQLARLESVGPASKPDIAVMQVIKRFESAYRFEAQTRQAASASVTSLTKASGGTANPDSADALQRKLDFPEFFVAQSAPKPTDVGTATHLVLQHLDFAAADMPGDLPRQIDAMQSAKLISAREAKLVDQRTVRWLLESDLGTLLKTHRSNLMREVPFALARGPDGCAPVNGGEAMDLVMVRGRIDLLLPLPQGLAIVDYKTDNLTSQWIAQRTDSYRAQMEMYRQAVEEVAGQKVAAVYLVFLNARQIMTL